MPRLRPSSRQDMHNIGMIPEEEVALFITSHLQLLEFSSQVIREAEDELAEEEEEARRRRRNEERSLSCSGPEDLSDVELDLIGDFMVKESLDVAAGRLSASPRPPLSSRHSMVFNNIVKFVFKFLKHSCHPRIGRISQQI